MAETQQAMELLVATRPLMADLGLVSVVTPEIKPLRLAHRDLQPYHNNLLIEVYKYSNINL